MYTCTYMYMYIMCCINLHTYNMYYIRTCIPDPIIHMKIHVPSMLTICVEIINKQTK